MASKYDPMREEVERLLDENHTVTEICEKLGIPLGTIPYLIDKWGLKEKQVRHTGKYKPETIATWSKTCAEMRSRGPHWNLGRWKVRGQVVSPEEVCEELKGYVEQDLTIAQMADLMGVYPRVITKRLIHCGLQQGIRSGDRCSWWKGGHKKYRGPGWQTIRRQALKRDGYKCKDCGLRYQEALDRGHALNVHHLVPYEKTQDNSLENLITLCQPCHMKREWRDGTYAN